MKVVDGEIRIPLPDGYRLAEAGERLSGHKSMYFSVVRGGWVPTSAHTTEGSCFIYAIEDTPRPQVGKWYRTKHGALVRCVEFSISTLRVVYLDGSAAHLILSELEEVEPFETIYEWRIGDGVTPADGWEFYSIYKGWIQPLNGLMVVRHQYRRSRRVLKAEFMPEGEK